MPTIYQKESLEAILGLLLEATGISRASNCPIKSPSATSRFLNKYKWPTRKLIIIFRKWMLQQILSYSKKGRRPHLQVIIDLTTLEKRGKFKDFDGAICTYNKKRGLHLVVLYLVVGKVRIPWNFRVYRGKRTISPANLARRLLCSLPKILKRTFNIMVLGDSAFSSIAFLKTVIKLKIHAVVGIRNNRSLSDDRKIKDLHKGGQQIHLKDLPFPVSVAHYYFKKDDGKYLKRYVIFTKQLKPSTLVWWGKRRWQIEGFFKTIKDRFSLDCFGQETKLGVYRWLILSFISFVLAYWTYGLERATGTQLNWTITARKTLETLFPSVLLNILLQDIERLEPIAAQHGINIQIQSC